MKSNVSLENKVLISSLILFGFSPILPEKLKGLPVVVFFIAAILVSLKKKSLKFNFQGFFQTTSIFWILFLSIFYTTSLYFPGKKIESALSLVIIPLSFYLIDKGKNKLIERNTFYKVYILCAGVLSFSCITYYYFNDLFYPENFKVNSFRKLVTKIPIINDHPIYICIYSGIAILLIYKSFKVGSKKERFLYTILALIISANLFLLSSKGVIVATIAATIIYILFTLKNKITKVTIILTLVIFFIGSIIYFPNLERRFRELGIKTTYTELHLQNSSSLRLAIYKCAIDKIIENPIFGYGWGKGKLALMECYKTKSDHLYQKKYNTHNQFMSYYLDGGLPATLVLFLFLFNLFILSYNKKDYIYFATIFFFTIVMLVENILERQSGLILFIFLICFFKFVKKIEEKNSKKY